LIAACSLAVTARLDAQSPAAPPSAQAPAPPGSPSAAGAPGADWQPRTEAVIGQLQRGEWAAAEAGSRSLLREMVAWIAGGEGASRSIALMTAFQAVAEAGLRREDDALWHWHIAQQIVPEISAMKMGMFGAAGAVLLGQEPRRDCAAAVVEGADVTRPRPSERPKPEYPEALRAAGVHGLVTIEALVGADGTPRSPRVLTPDAPPTLILAAAESLRRSRFAPAQRAGIAVPYCYSSTMRFELIDRPKR
jgi:hypothetical protein